MIFHLDIITLERQVYSQDVEEVTVPTVNGTIGVLPRHMRLFSALTEGEVKVTQGNSQYYFAIGGGFVDVTRDIVSILVSRAYHADELNEAEIKRAQDAAKAVLNKRGKNEEYYEAQAIFQRSVLQLKVLKRKHTHVRTAPAGFH